ncbi:MAG TPA: EAL domain-containing protein [Gammaproteobacteria bacterium]|nr:EAL domain-containing protein [Gammaproteobacteria bacterium]
MNIEQKNTLFIVGLVLTVLAGVAGAAYLLLRDQVAAGIEADLERNTRILRHLQDGRPGKRPAGPAADLRSLHRVLDIELVLLAGKKVLSSSSPALKRAVKTLSGFPPDGKTRTLSLDGSVYSIRVLPLAEGPATAAEAPLRIVLAVPHARYWMPYRELAGNALYFSLFILLVAALAGISISRRSLTRPLQLLARATRAIAEGKTLRELDIRRRDELGQLMQSFMTMQAELNASRNELRNSRRRFRDFAASSSDWLWETDRSGNFTFVSTSVADTLEMPAESWLGRSLSEVFPHSNLGELMALLRPPASRLSRFKDVEIWVKAPSGTQHCIRLNGVPVMVSGRFAGFRGTARDITQSKQDQKRMVLLANHDQLTGLSNRRCFLQDLSHEIRRMEDARQSGVLLLIDIDHLKLVNDTAGHAAGDQIIVQVAGLLKRMSRDQDLLARISGDEFAIAYSAMDEALGIDKAGELLNRISQLKPRHAGRSMNISASIGLVSFPVQGRAPVELLAKADAAMSVAKGAGRNCVRTYRETDSMRAHMDNQLVWKDRLLEALDKDRLVLMFQPIVSVASGATAHYEVLVRMRGGDDELIPPGHFIPAAEQFGLIQRVDRWVLTHAIRYLAGLPPGQQNTGLSINLSGMSVGSDQVWRCIEEEIRQAGIDPARITFEITETAACEQIDSAADFIQRIRQLGCRISLDDFGVGFSSFSYLKHLRADLLKIDGSFIRDIHNSQADQLFVKALVDVARGLGMRTIAEFVESEQVYERVRALGVDYVQGYYLGRPRREPLPASVGVAGPANGSMA